MNGFDRCKPIGAFSRSYAYTPMASRACTSAVHSNPIRFSRTRSAMSRAARSGKPTYVVPTGVSIACTSSDPSRSNRRLSSASNTYGRLRMNQCRLLLESFVFLGTLREF